MNLWKRLQKTVRPSLKTAAGQTAPSLLETDHSISADIREDAAFPNQPQPFAEIPGTEVNWRELPLVLFKYGFDPNAVDRMPPRPVPPDPFSFKGMTEALPTIEVSPQTPGSHVKPPSSRKLGTYGDRYAEQRRLNINALGQYESEHVLGYATVNPNVSRSSPDGSRLEADMPAYYESMHLHQEHAGSGMGRRQLDPQVHGGWQTVHDFRQDQQQTLKDPVAAGEGTSVSNGYQLTKLGYAHILGAEQNGLSQPHTVPDYLRRYPRTSKDVPGSYYVGNQEALSTNSYNNMVRNDPPIVHRLNGADQQVRLGPRGQAEALLAREMAMTGNWPSNQRIQEVSADVLPPPVYREKKEIWDTADIVAAEPPPAYDPRDRRQAIGL